jgi:hypothetical protein
MQRTSRGKRGLREDAEDKERTQITKTERHVREDAKYE